MKMIVRVLVVTQLLAPTFAHAFGSHAPHPCPSATPSATPTPTPTYTPSPVPSPSPTPLTQAQLDANLMASISDNDEAGVQTWLAQGANANDIPAGYSAAPITYAAQNDNIAIMTDLVKTGANVNELTNGAGYALTAANQYPDAISFLLSQGADPNLASIYFNDSNVMPPVNVFAANDSCDVNSNQTTDLTQDLTLLLAKNPNMAAVDSLGRNSLFSIKCGNASTSVATYENVATQLLKAGAQLSLRDNDGNTPFTALYDLESTHDDAFFAKAKFLVAQGADPSSVTNHGSTLLMKAAAASDEDSVVFYLSLQKIDVNAKNDEGKTALIYAAINGDSASATALLDAGACQNIIDTDGKTALGEAIDNSRTDLATLLKTYAARPQSQDCAVTR
jgi:ankyrin repeat protein